MYFPSSVWNNLTGLQRALTSTTANTSGTNRTLTVSQTSPHVRSDLGDALGFRPEQEEERGLSRRHDVPPRTPPGTQAAAALNTLVLQSQRTRHD